MFQPVLSFQSFFSAQRSVWGVRLFLPQTSNAWNLATMPGAGVCPICVSKKCFILVCLLLLCFFSCDNTRYRCVWRCDISVSVVAVQFCSKLLIFGSTFGGVLLSLDNICWCLKGKKNQDKHLPEHFYL